MRPLGAVALLSLAVPIPRAPNHMQRPRALETGPRPQWGALEPGRYGVGFRLAAEYDHSRRIAPSVDFEGRRNAGPLAMALPVAVWYPTAPAQSSRPVEYGMFAALASKRADLTPVSAAERAAAIDGMRAFAGFAFGRQTPESAMRAVDTTVTAAVRDAAPAAGPFPVVLAATDGSLAAATVLFEYLASHGRTRWATGTGTPATARARVRRGGARSSGNRREDRAAQGTIESPGGSRWGSSFPGRGPATP